MNQKKPLLPVGSATRHEDTGLAAAHSDAAIPLARAGRLLATVALMLASGMQAADATIANVALPQMERDLGGGLALAAWVMTSYLAAAALAAPLTGALRRRLGLRMLFAIAVGTFTLASLLCALAPTAGLIIAFRVLQGAGGGVIHPMAQAILLDLYPRERHGRMLGIWGSAIMVGPVVGPALGGFITDLASWRWVFAVNVPLGALAIAIMWRVLRETAPTAKAAIDFVGVAFLIIGVGALELGLQSTAAQASWRSPEFLAEIAIGVIAALGIAMRMRAGTFTVFRPGAFRDRNFAVAAFYNFTWSGLIFVGIVLVPLLVQGPLGGDARLAGATIIPRGIAMMLSMLAVGQLIGKVPFRTLLVTGVGLMAAGLILLSAVGLKHPLPLVIVGSTVQSIGGGILFTSLSTVAFSTLPPDTRTDATGVYSLLRQLGCASAVALMTAVLRAKIAANLAMVGSDAADHTALATHLRNLARLHAYDSCFSAMAVAALVVIPGLWWLGPRSRTVETTPEPLL